MFAYNPSVNDNSGQILAAGQVGAAQANAQMMGQVGENIGGALQAIGGMYGEAKEKRADGESAFGALQQMAQMYPSMNKMVKGLEQLDPRTRGMAASQVLGNFGALSQFAVANMYNQTRQNSPFASAGLKGATLVAGGEGTVPLPVEPPLPVMDNSTLPPSQPSQPSPDAMSAANAWYNQSKSGMIPSGAMRPFYR
jgi:hypothetical protein